MNKQELTYEEEKEVQFLLDSDSKLKRRNAVRIVIKNRGK